MLKFVKDLVCVEKYCIFTLNLKIKIMSTDIFYPEMEQTAKADTEIIIELLYSKYKVVCLNGLELKESRSIKFQFKRENGDNVYYATQAGVKKLEKQYKVSTSILLD